MVGECRLVLVRTRKTSKNWSETGGGSICQAERLLVNWVVSAIASMMKRGLLLRSRVWLANRYVEL